TMLKAEEKQEIQNLRSFTKLYGYVKYFHPSDEASEVDWDKFAIYGVERVLSAKSSEELKVILEELFLPIAPTIQIYYSDEKPESFVITEDNTDLEVVAWQHLGVGLGAFSNIYRSIRVNRENLIPQPNYGFGTVTQSINAKDYRGKEIKLEAYVRTNVSGSGNQGQLWLRVDRKDKDMGFFDNMNDRPIIINEWKEYEIVGNVADDAEYIVFGCFLKGLGQVWVDGFQLSYKDSNGDWQPIPIENPGFEEEHLGKPKMWSAESPGYTYKIENDNPQIGKNCLLIENKGEGYIFKGTLFDEYPKVGEVVNKELGSGLFCQIPLAIYSDSTRTLGQKNKTSFENLLSELNKIDIDELTTDNEYVRLGDVVIAWNVFQHFYPYFDVVDVDWNEELTITFEEVLTNQNGKDFYYSLNRMIAKLKDGHGHAIHEVYDKQAGFMFVVNWIENQVVITLSKDTNNFKLGDIILSIDGVPAEQILINDEEFISGSPQYKRKISTYRFSFGGEGTIAKIKIKRNGEVFEIEAGRNRKGHLSKNGRQRIEEIEESIYYINLSKADMQEINEKIDVIADAKGVIFDLRGYPNSNHEIISYLLTKPDTSKAWMRVSQIIYPDQENIVGFEEYGWEMQTKEPHIQGKVVFLIDGRAISYCESFMSFIEHYKLAEIVGQPTAGTNGNVNPFLLPGGFKIRWTGMKVLKHDGSQHHLIGIQPTVPVERTIQGVIEGRDEFLEKALEIIEGETESE
ncbi:MAG: peptidase S41, partial [Ignavibacteria bacterium]|nr:peptidase S41 [Ignavibacteria bacterium]